jgi:5-formyltetrahydrofolate cyclo-ligase
LSGTQTAAAITPVTTTPTKALRDELRSHFRQLRKNLSAEDQTAYANRLVQQTQHQVLASAQGQQLKLALYLSFDGELDTAALIKHCWDAGHEVYLPLLHPFSPGQLLFQRYAKTTTMTKNHFGIDEPVLDVRAVVSAKQLDTLFTPLVAFDDSGNRLGMGGGFYDRTLSSMLKAQDLPLSHKTRVIGLAHDLQKTDSLPCAAWDIPLPEIITPSHHFIFAPR